MIDVTRLYCLENPGKGAPGEGNTTHHLVPRYPKDGGSPGSREMRCAYCGKTQYELRTARVAEIRCDTDGCLRTSVVAVNGRRACQQHIDDEMRTAFSYLHRVFLDPDDREAADG